jgi:glycosyltransferase involved in cell wall biosynthesis
MSKVAVISLLGIEHSGVAMAAMRYGEALRSVLVNARVLISGSVDEPSHGVTIYATADQLLSKLLEDGPDRYDTLIWVGLHSSDEVLTMQLNAVSLLHQRGCFNIVVPERTGRELAESLANLESIRDCIDALVFYNPVQAESWKRLLASGHTWSTHIVPPPVPDEYFAAGATRRATQQMSDRVTFLYVGRMLHRKGVDRLLRAWPSIQTRLRSAQVKGELALIGSHFGDTLHLRRRLDGRVADPGSGVSWHPQIRGDLYTRFNDRNVVGVSLSRQEFDALALTEMLAAGIPVIASTNDGHRAIRRESSAICLVSSDSDFICRCVDLATSVETIQARGAQGGVDMRRSRSMLLVGALLVGVLETMQSC